MADIQVKIFEDNAFAFADIVLYQDMGDHYLTFRPIITGAGQIAWGWERLDEGEKPVPTFRLPRSLSSRNVLKALVNEIADLYGVVSEGAEDAKSVLEAKQEHLEDLRSLLFTSDWIEVQRGEPAEEKGNADL